MGLPASAFQLTMVILVAIFTSIFRKSRLIAMACVFLVAIAGILMIKLLPEHQKLRRIAGFWLVMCIAPAFPPLMKDWRMLMRRMCRIMVFDIYCSCLLMEASKIWQEISLWFLARDSGPRGMDI